MYKKNMKSSQKDQISCVSSVRIKLPFSNVVLPWISAKNSFDTANCFYMEHAMKEKKEICAVFIQLQNKIESLNSNTKYNS